MDKSSVIEIMGRSLEGIGELLNANVAEIGELIGMEKESIEMMNSNGVMLSQTAYVALCGVLDNFILNKRVSIKDIKEVIKRNTSNDEKLLIENLENSFITQWIEVVSEERISNKIKKVSEYLSETYKIFIDDTFLMKENSEAFLEKFVPAFKEKNNALIVPLRVIEDLQEAEKGAEIDTSNRARTALKTVTKFQKEESLEVRGESNDPNVYSTFISVFAKYKAKRPLFLLSQNTLLAEDLLEMNKKKAMKGFSIGAGYLNNDGGIDLFEENEEFLLEQLSENINSFKNEGNTVIVGDDEFSNEPFGIDDEITDEDLLVMEEIREIEESIEEREKYLQENSLDDEEYYEKQDYEYNYIEKSYIDNYEETGELEGWEEL